MLHTLWFGYGWPSLQGNGPEGIIQSALFGLAGYFVGRAAKKHAGRLHAKLDLVLHHHDVHKADLSLLNDKLDAVLGGTSAISNDPGTTGAAVLGEGGQEV